eukprot:1947689-Pleurochrysis_carterae.AAC.2
MLTLACEPFSASSTSTQSDRKTPELVRGACCHIPCDVQSCSESLERASPVRKAKATYLPYAASPARSR